MKKLRKALYATHLDTLDFDKVQMLYPLQASGLEEVILLFVVDRDEVGFVPYGGFDKELAEDLLDRARLRFSDWSRDIEKSGLRCKSVVETGRPATKILEVAEREDVDLIVAARRHHVALDAIYLGGTAMELLRRSPVPVLVCKEPESGCCPVPSKSIFARVLHATDFTAASAPALEFCKDLAGAARHVDVVYVIGEPDLERLSESELRAEEKVLGERLEAICGELRGVGIAAEAHLRAGKVEDELLSAVEDRDSTVIVMSTTEKEGLRELWQGSISHRVAELSPVPVLLVPALGVASRE
jgi:nucleotide-binding universal stress UspA family protein